MSLVFHGRWTPGRFFSILALVACGAIAGCGNAGPADIHSGNGLALDVDGKVSSDSQADDAASIADGTDLDGLDYDASGQAELPGYDVVADCPGGALCPCNANTDCQSGLCIEDLSVDGGKACAKPCKPSCGPGYVCANLTGSGSDIQQVCVYQAARLCDPCGSSKDCEVAGLADSKCVDQGAMGRFCGVACSADADCPTDYACTEVAAVEGGKFKQCVRKADPTQQPYGVCICNSLAVQKKLVTACYVEVKDASGQVSGKCMGQRACTPAGLSSCAAPEAKGEVCNGQDDDCDGQTDEASCDDGKACTQDSCAGVDGCKYKLLDGEPCDADGSVCTEGDACQAGACVAGAKKDCDDKNPCTKDSCEMAKGCTQIADDGKPCDADGTACTAGDVCQGGKCQQGQLVVCDDGSPCSIDTCDPKTGQCASKAEDDGVPCDDGTKCTNKDACLGGSCKGKAVDCDDSNPCTDDVCDKAKGCWPAPLSGSPCSDENPCTVGDLCAAGACKPGQSKVCVAPSSCVVAMCDLTQNGACTFENADAGTPCDDGSACTDKDNCASGKCKGALKNCDDGNTCTDDGCDAKLGCTTTNNSNPCSDANACTVLDKCAGGLCAGKAIDAKVDCDDGNPCTVDLCEPKGGCGHSNNQASCDDGNACTQGDQCNGGTCQPGASTCACQSDSDCAKLDDADLCNGKLYCDKAVAGQFACKIKVGSVVQCNVALNTACSTQVCAPATGQCGAVAADDGKGCDADGSVCSSADACLGGVCKPGPAVVCDDKNPCTTDSCDAKLGCGHVANTAPCDADGDACTVGDVCQSKVCLAGTKKPCDDNEPCTVDSCDKAIGACVFAGSAAAGKACDDGSLCTEGDQCSGGVCAAGKAKQCNDQNPCTDDNCDAKKGCIYTANAQPCDDGNACTTADLCGGSVCTGKPLNVQVDCDDGNPCTSDGCDPKAGCTHAANQLPCDDGNPCTQGDLCAAKACTAGSNVCGCQKDTDCAAQEDGDLCNGTLYCDTAKLPYTCKVKAATVVVCDASKNTLCATNTCDAKSGKCSALAAPDAKSCDADGSVCTAGDACLGGLCKAGAAVDCDDDNLCTTDSCDPLAGCKYVANTLACNADKSVCTVDDTCKDGLCLKGAAKDCDDKNACTTDSCDAVAGCKSVANTIGCDDGNACTSGDACAAGNCGGVGITCDDKDPCTADSCDVVKGCLATALAEKADCSGDGKNWCLAGKCVLKANCGNGVVEGTEACDDGNTVAGDGCSASCTHLCASVWSPNMELPPVPITSAMTIEMWLNYTNEARAANWTYLWRGYNSPACPQGVGSLNLYSNTLLAHGNTSQPGISVTAPPANQWNHLALQYGPGVTKLFLNGQLVGTVNKGAGLIGSCGAILNSWAGVDLQPAGVWIDSLRVSTGQRYPDAGFNPALLVADASTLILSDFNEGKGVTSTNSGSAGGTTNMPKSVDWKLACSSSAGVCAANSPTCLGNLAGTCNAQGTGLVSAADCSASGKICSAGQCVYSYASCKAVQSASPAAQDGIYLIDPDGIGPIAPANLFCDMKNGGWTLVGNYYDSTGDDMPNTTDYVVSGWQQTASGKWDAKALTVDRAWGGGTGSAAVSLAFVEALGKALGQKNIKMCLVHKDGYDASCRQSSDGSLTLASYNTGNPKLTAYSADKLTYTFGRLGGLAGSGDGYSNMQESGYCMAIQGGVAAGEWGDANTLCEQNCCGVPTYKGVWHAWGGGIEFMPPQVGDDELRLGGGNSAANPSVNSHGFRLYVGQ